LIGGGRSSDFSLCTSLPIWTVQIIVALKAQNIPRIYSSGNCAGFSPASLLVPARFLTGKPTTKNKQKNQIKVVFSYFWWKMFFFGQ
jgi:hypothetical protein